LKTASRDNTQLIIATHSPLLLNLFELDEILIFEKDDTNQTVVSIRTEDDFEDWNEDFLVGQLWLRGLIGGKRW
jgi:predicted ATPase